MTGLARVATGPIVILGAGTWFVTFALLAVERPGLDSWLWAWPFTAAMAIASGVGLATLSGRPPFSRGVGRAAGALLAVAAVGLIAVHLATLLTGGFWDDRSGILAIGLLISTPSFLVGSVLIGAALLRSARSRAAGALIAVAAVLFVATRPWTLGVSPTGIWLVAWQAVEIAIAGGFAVGWAWLGVRLFTQRGEAFSSRSPAGRETK